MIFLYDGKQKVQGIGKCALDDIIIDSKCYWKKNDYFYIELIIIKDENLKYKKIKELDIIKCQTPFGKNTLFRVKGISKNENSITVTAKHVFYDLEHYFIQDAFSENKNGQAAIEHLLKACDQKTLLKGTSDISILASQRIVRKDCCTAFISDEDNSFVNRYKAWLSFGDYFDFALNKDVSNNRGFKVSYEKNINGYDANIDYNSIVTRIYCLAYDGIVCGSVDSPNVDKYPLVFSTNVEFSNYRLKEEGKEYTEEELQEFNYYDDVEILKGDVLVEANKLFATGIDLPVCSFDIDLIALEDTVEYENIKTLVKLFPNDEVEVLIKDADISVTESFNEFEYDLVTNKYIVVRLGADQESFFTKNSSSTNDIVNKVLDKITIPSVDLSGYATQEYIDGIKSDLESLIHNGIENSYVIVKDNEILIMDTQDINTCVNCIRMNKNGIACSQSGYMGPYTAALGINGKFNLVEATCNKITANLIQGGIISDVNNTTNINLETGTFNFHDYIVWDGSTFSIKLNSGNTIESELNNYNTTLNNRIDAVSKKIDDTLTDVNATLTDGVIDEAEKLIIENSLIQLDAEKQAVFEEYTTLNSNADLTGTAKTNLQQAYSQYNTIHNDLKNVINTIIADDKVDDSEKQSYNTKCDEYKTAFATVKKRLNEALQAIADKKAENVKAYTDTQISAVNGKIETSIKQVTGNVNELKQDYADYKTKVNKDIADVNSKVDTLMNDIDSAIADSVISASERELIKSHLVELQREKVDIDSRYNAVYNNTKLTGTPKSNLKTAKDNFNTSHTNLVTAINNIIADDTVTEDERTAFNNALSDYNSKLSVLSTRFEEAIDAIGNAKIEELDKEYIEKFSSIQQTVDNITTTVGKNTTSISNVDKSFNDYKTATDSKLSSMQSQINKFSDDVSGAISDNILTEAEVRMIKNGLDDLKTQKDTAYATYLEIYNNKYLDANVKTNLKNAWTTYESKYNTLVQTINNLIADENIDESERTAYNTAMSNYQASYSSLETQIQKALDNISTKKIAKSEETLRSEMSVIDQKADNILIKVESNTKSISNSNKALEDYKTSTNSKLNSMQSQINKFSTDVGAAISDNILTEAEIKIIKNDLNDLKTQRDTIYETYNEIYNNSYLDVSIKSGLGGAWSSYSSRYTTLVDTINNLITDSQITDEERTAYNTAILNYQASYATLERQIQRALDNISTKKIAKSETTLNNKIAAVDVKADSISSKVEETATNVKKNANNITTLQNRVTSAESKITADAIVNTVKAATDANGSKTFVVSSELAQTANNITMSFSNSGGYNLVRNGCGNKNLNYWYKSDSTKSKRITMSSSNVCPFTSQIRIDNISTGAQVFMCTNRFPVKKSTEYTLSFYVKYASSAVKNITVEYYSYNTGVDNTVSSRKEWFTTIPSNPVITTLDNNLAVKSAWKRVVYKFTTPSNGYSGFIKISHNGTTATNASNSYVCFTGVMVNEGAIYNSNGTLIARPFSYHPEEIYDSSTIIDGTGISVLNGGISIYKGNDESTQRVLYGDASGNLHITGQLESCSMKSGSIQSTNGDLYLDLNDSNLIIKHNGSKVGQMIKNHFKNTTQYGLSLGSEYNYYTCLSSKTSSGDDAYQVMLSTWGKNTTVSGKNYKTGVNLHYDLWCHGQNINDCNGIFWNADGNQVEVTDKAEIYPYYSNKKSTLCLKIEDDDDDEIMMACYRSSTNEHKGLCTFAWNGINFYRPLDMHYWGINNAGSVQSASVMSANYYSEEEQPTTFAMATYDSDTDTYTKSESNTFYTNVAKSTQNTITEIGSVVVNKTAKVYLPEGYVYSDYFVQITPIGNHSAYISEKLDDYFIIKSTEEDAFTCDYLITLKQPSQNIATDLMNGRNTYTLRQVPSAPVAKESKPLES